MENSFAKIISKIWEDPKFKEEFMKDPRFYLQNEGIEIPENVKVVVHENTDEEIHITIPQKPTGELTENELKAISGGVFFVIPAAIVMREYVHDSTGSPSTNIGKQIS